jgi:hypothetical protein
MMMNRRTGTLLTFAALVLAAFGTVTMAADSGVATWKLDLAKSTFNPGPAPKSRTITIAAWGSDGMMYTADGVDAAGRPSHWEYQVKYDGKFMPVKGNPNADMISYSRIDANTLESTTQFKGSPAMKSRAVVSADGKIRTMTETGKNATGQDVHNVAVYDKQ